MGEEWIDAFDTEKFELVAKGMEKLSGVTLDTIRLVEMISSLVNDKKLGSKA